MPAITVFGTAGGVNPSIPGASYYGSGSVNYSGAGSAAEAGAGGGADDRSWWEQARDWATSNVDITGGFSLGGGGGGGAVNVNVGGAGPAGGSAAGGSAYAGLGEALNSPIVWVAVVLLALKALK